MDDVLILNLILKISKRQLNDIYITVHMISIGDTIGSFLLALANVCLCIFYLTYVHILYGGKLWWWEMANLANDRGFDKFIPAKLYPVKEILT